MDGSVGSITYSITYRVSVRRSGNKYALELRIEILSLAWFTLSGALGGPENIPRKYPIRRLLDAY